MENFKYYTPTKVIFGKDTEKEIGNLLKEFNGKKILIHYGGGSVVRSGLLAKVKNYLKESNIDYIELGGVKPNPRLSLVKKGIELGKRENIDFILAIGGGSVIDSAKGIGYGMMIDYDVWDLYSKNKFSNNCMPIGVILTMAAAGSEMSPSSVITNEEGWLKRSFSIDNARPKFAILNPELTYTLPKYQSASGIVDIMMHTMERYFSPTGNMEITDEIAEGLIRTVIRNAPIIMENPADYESRGEIMWASSLAHNGLTGCGGTGDWSSHQLEHELGGIYDVAHGAGLSAIWGSWARYVFKENPKRFARFANKIFNIENIGDENTALLGIETMEKFYKSIDMPTNLKELGLELSLEEIKILANKCSFNGKRTIGSFKELTEQDMFEIYNNAK
ncbi:iron-containing alcohol dehydrogenase [Fusobacterium sp. IOR10]|uniref:iron-containing alcohol dehydrogenase n=1 Tax=Fusobacterium sp. IOR10 TaxID=2665157 RepID=UPI0013D17047|nr:iron-containing alcohol dehydrogenase [Fusobacterium sp. IOR10]